MAKSKKTGKRALLLQNQTSEPITEVILGQTFEFQPGHSARVPYEDGMAILRRDQKRKVAGQPFQARFVALGEEPE